MQGISWPSSSCQIWGRWRNWYKTWTMSISTASTDALAQGDFSRPWAHSKLPSSLSQDLPEVIPHDWPPARIGEPNPWLTITSHNLESLESRFGQFSQSSLWAIRSWSLKLPSHCAHCAFQMCAAEICESHRSHMLWQNQEQEDGLWDKDPSWSNFQDRMCTKDSSLRISIE